MFRIFACLAALLATPAAANDWDALNQPGVFAIMRHALAPGGGDPANLRIGDCSTQRNLDARGREQARTIGAEFKARGIAFDAIYSSQWCRTRETAELLDLGPVQEWPSLNSFFSDFSTRDSQTRESLNLIAGLAGARVMLVTHQVNISALTGRGTRSGEVLIVRRGTDRLDVLGAVLISP